MVFREDEKRPELDIMGTVFDRVKIYVEQNWNSRTDQVHKNDHNVASQLLCQSRYTPYEQHCPLNVVRQGLTNVACTYRAVSSDTEKLHVEPKDDH